jgi:choline-sulfatase
MRISYDRRTFLALSAASMAAVGCAPKPRAVVPPNIVVYLADSLRKDGLGCLGAQADSSPVLDALAREAFVFENCYAQCSWTKPSIASLFTGMLPSVHQAAVTTWRAHDAFDQPRRRLPAQYPTWAESMKSLGYQTASFQSNPHPSTSFGYDRGFDHYHFLVNEDTIPQVAQFEQWLDTTPTAPFFAFIHQMDPHAPYTPAEEHFLAANGVERESMAERLSSGDRKRAETWTQLYVDGDGHELLAYQAEMRNLSPDGIAYMRALYNGMVRGVDDAAGRLLTALTDRGLIDNTVFVFISDHGEAFAERSRFGHGWYLHNEEVRVPMIIKMPGQETGARIDTPVALFDLYPTCVALGGGMPSSSLMAKPLLDAAGMPTVPADRPVFAEVDTYQPDGWYWNRVMISGDRAVMRTEEDVTDATVTAYDLAADPGQRQGLDPGTIEDSAEWKPVFAAFHEAMAEHQALAAQTAAPDFAPFDPVYEEELQAVGYT